MGHEPSQIHPFLPLARQVTAGRLCSPRNAVANGLIGFNGIVEPVCEWIGRVVADED